MNIKQQIEAARADGYSYAEIGEFLSKNNSQIKSALADGYTINDVLGHFGVKAEMPVPPKDFTEPWTGADATANAATLNYLGPKLKATESAARETIRSIDARIGKEKGLVELTPQDRSDLVQIVKQFPDLYSHARDVYEKSAGQFAKENPGTQAMAEIAGSTPITLAATTPVMGGLRALGGMAATGTAARVAQTVPRFLSGGSGYAKTGGALPGMLGARIASQGAAGAGEGALGALVNQNLTPDEDVGDQTATGAKYGAVIGSVLGPAANRLGNALRGPAMAREEAQLAQWAIDNGIDLRASQLSSSSLRRGIDSALSVLPFSGRQAQIDTQMGQFTKRLAQTFGGKADNLSKETMKASEKRIGKVFNTAAAGGQIDDTAGGLLLDLSKIENKWRGQGLGDTEYKRIQSQIDTVFDNLTTGGNKISGAEYQRLTNKGSPLDLMIRNKNTDIHLAGREIREALDAALERSSPADVVASIAEARKHWKNLKTVERLAQQNQPAGMVSPKQMQTFLDKVIQRNPKYASEGAGDVGQLAQVGTNFIKDEPGAAVANSNAFRHLLINSLGVTGAAGGLAAMGEHPGAAAATVGGALTLLGGGKVLNKLANRRGATRDIIDRTLKPEGGGLPLLTRAAIQAAAEESDQNNETKR